MKILITGKTGMLGGALFDRLGKKHEITGISTDDADITDINQIGELIHQINPELVIHSAAYTDVDGCERNYEKAIMVNGYGTRNVAVACQKIDAKMLYISTDYVFDGKTRAKGYQVYDRTDPINIYGHSKLMGEQFTSCLLQKFYIVRTSWIFGPNGKNFVKTIINKAKEKEVEKQGLRVVNDQVGSPTCTLDLACKIEELIETDCFGTYHITNSGFCSWFDFAKMILKLAGFEHIPITPVSTNDFKRDAKRPAFSILNNNHLNLNGLNLLRSWEEAVSEYISLLL